jgi:hypothetical protein
MCTGHLCIEGPQVPYLTRVAEKEQGVNPTSFQGAHPSAMYRRQN